MFTPTIKLEHADARGEIYSIQLPDNRELMLLHSNPGSWRGGHHHSCDEVVVVLTGKMDYWKNLHGRDIVHNLQGGETSFNTAGQIHMGHFTEDSWVVEWKLAKKGEWTQEDFEPYREAVRASSKAA